MDPRELRFAAGTPRDEVIETDVAKLVPAVGRENNVAGGRSRLQRAQRLQPAHESAAALGGRLPPRAARGHHDDGRAASVASGDGHDDIARLRWRAGGKRHDAKL